LERTELTILFVSLKAAQNSRQKRRSSKDFAIGREHAMTRHRLNLLADLGDDARGSTIRWMQCADGVHQRLDRDRGVVDLSQCYKIVQHWR
jgi:hypothetical protein